MVGGSDVLLLTDEPGRRRRVLDVLRAADAVVTVSSDLETKLVEFGVPRPAVHIVGRGVDSQRFAPGNRAEARSRLGLAADGRALLWVGRMHPVKGLDVLLEACSILRQRGSAFRLYLVGDGSLRPSLEADSRARGLSEVVSFVGPVPQEQLADWYRAADYFVLPSRSEGIPNVLRESLACGTPFVASRVGGIPELVGGLANRLVPPGDPTALAGALAQALSEPAPASGWAFHSPDWTESARTLLDVLRPLVAPAPEKVYS
jgi:glycosyltransferase involved in cell wall biosynthesis